MPVYKDEKRGTWYSIIRIKDPVSGKSTQIKKRGFPTKREAKQWESEQLVKDSKPSAATFRELNRQYVEYKNARPATQHQELMRVDKYFGDYCDKQIEKVTKAHLLRWQIWLDQQDLSTQTKNYMVSVVKGTYAFANAFYGIPNISLVLKRFKKPQSENMEMQTWTVPEFNQFIKAVTSPYYKAFFIFLYWTGCRRGEAMALRKEDFTGSKVKIRHAIKYMADGFIDLKNDKSIRTITMDDELTRFMQPLIDRCTKDAPFVFGGDVILPITNIQRHFNAGIKASGVKKIRLHDLRHSFATNAINHGCNIVAVSRYLGHSTIEQTLETYAHLLEKTESEMVSIMTSLH